MIWLDVFPAALKFLDDLAMVLGKQFPSPCHKASSQWMNLVLGRIFTGGASVVMFIYAILPY